MNIIDLKKIFRGDVDNTNNTLNKYSTDASIFEIRPEVVVYPKDIEDIKNLVNFVSREKEQNYNISLTPRSAGTDMSGGAVNDSIIVDFTRYINKFLEIGDDYAVTETGLYYRDFEKKTLEKNMILPSYPASKSLCAMGGIISNNSGGEKSLSYGKTEKYLEEIKTVLSDGNEYDFSEISEELLKQKIEENTFEGNIYKKIYNLLENNYDLIQKHKPTVSKNSAGYALWNIWNRENKTFNLAKLFCGAQGTLGLIVSGKLKLIKPHKKSCMLVIFLKDVKDLGNIVNGVMKHKPETFESFDNHTLSLALKFLPAMLKKMKGNIFSLAFQFLPELKMVLTGGLPKLILIAEFTGDDVLETRNRTEEAQREIEKKFGLKTHITKNENESQKYWTVRRESFSLLREKVKNLHSAPFIDDFSVHPDDLPVFLPKLDEIFKKYPSLVYTIAGHAGDANFHIIPLMDLSKKTERDIIPLLSKEVYNLVLEFNGSITAEHNDGIVRGPYLEKMYGTEIFNLFKEIKNIFDPLNIFNPHKKTDATEEFLIGNIKKK